MAPTKRPRTKHAAEWRAVVHWHREAVHLDFVGRDTHPHLKKHGWYVIITVSLDRESRVAPLESIELMYIGDAFNQNLRSRVQQPRPALERVQATCPPEKELAVMLGVPTQRSRKRRSRDHLDGVLHALRKRHRCAVQEPLTQPYQGQSVSVTNEGEHYPIKSRILLRPTKTNSSSSEEHGNQQAAAKPGAVQVTPAVRTPVRRRKREGQGQQTP